MRIERIEHVQLAMPRGREDEARRFYAGALAIPEVEKPPELQKRGGAWFERDGLKVHIGVDANFHAATKAHVAFVVEGLHELRARLRAAGCDVLEDPLAGWDRIYTSDPFGNRIELMERA